MRIEKKPSLLFIALFSGWVLTSTGCSDGQRSTEDAGTVTMAQRQVYSGSVSKVGEVDWYRLPVAADNALVSIRLTSNTYRADVDLLATVYALDANGDKVRLYADHAPEDAQLPANVALRVNVENPGDLYVAVRDLLDDEASDNPYFLSWDVGSSTDDVNDSFASALRLQPDDASGCRQGTIGFVGDVDSYTFDGTADGVYQVLTEFSPFEGGTDVSLHIKLHDASGAIVDTLHQGSGNHHAMVHFLAAGTYYALVEDYGRNDFDTASSFSICVTSQATEEAHRNDTEAAATELGAVVANTYALTGSLDYEGDRDWYHFGLPEQMSGDFQVLDLRLDTADGDSNLVYALELRDASGRIVLSHDHQGGSLAFATQIKVEPGDYFLQVRPAASQTYAGAVSAAHYAVDLEVLDVDDPAEQDAANNTIDTAQTLAEFSSAAAGWSSGRISYRGDQDWFSVTTDTLEYKVLELFFESEAASVIEYQVVMMSDQVDKKMVDLDGSDGPTTLKGSLLLAPTESGEAITYYIKVADFQADDGDARSAYRIRANVRSVPDSIAADAGITGPLTYASEIGEQTTQAEQITLEQNSSSQKRFSVNTQVLNFNGESPNTDIVRVSNGATTMISMPWVAGYIDYEDDQDWYRLDLCALMAPGEGSDGCATGGPSAWFYDIRIELLVGEPGSDVEYVWKLYRDRGQNQILVDAATTTGDGFFASAGDTGTALEAIDLTTPGASEVFWANQDWQGAFYLSLADFNYVAAPLPDNDWGHGLPYHFRVTLVYHEGVSRP